MRRRILALIPAHNEEAHVSDTIASLANQTLEIADIVVVADNCTDRTSEVAARCGVTVFQTEGNTEKKAGALNQALASLLPGLDDGDRILVVDADSVLAPQFTETAVEALENPGVGAVGGIFYGRQGCGLLGLLQRSEYTRYARSIARKKDKAMVLTGTAQMFSVGVLREIQTARLDGRLPEAGGIYDTKSLTEDSEITIAIKSLGYKCLSPQACVVTTEVMPNLAMMWKQRIRWTRGALDNLRHYGVNRTTLPYVAQQIGLAASISVFFLFIVVFSAGLALGINGGFSLLWELVTAVFVLERVVTVRRNGWKAMAVALPLFIELAYDVFQHVVFVRALYLSIGGRKQEWMVS